VQVRPERDMDSGAGLTPTSWVPLLGNLAECMTVKRGKTAQSFRYSEPPANLTHGLARRRNVSVAAHAKYLRGEAAQKWAVGMSVMTEDVGFITQKQRKKRATDLFDAADDKLQELREMMSSNKAGKRNSASDKDIVKYSYHPVVTLTLYPPLRLRNLLCVPMQYRLTEAPSTVVARGVIPVGGWIPIFRVDPSRKLHLTVRILNYTWSSPLLVHNPKAAHPAKELNTQFELKRYTTSNNLKHSVQSLTARIPAVTMTLSLQGPDASVFCRVWIVNESELPLQYAPDMSPAYANVHANMYMTGRAAMVTHRSHSWAAGQGSGGTINDETMGPTSVSDLGHGHGSPGPSSEKNARRRLSDNKQISTAQLHRKMSVLDGTFKGPKLPEDEVAGAAVGFAFDDTSIRGRARDNRAFLEKALHHRPTRTALQQKNILQETFMMTFNVKLPVNDQDVVQVTVSSDSLMSEILQGIRAIKLLAWEVPMRDKIASLREFEMKCV